MKLLNKNMLTILSIVTTLTVCGDEGGENNYSNNYTNGNNTTISI